MTDLLAAQAQREAHAEIQGRIEELYRQLLNAPLPAYEHSKCVTGEWHDLKYTEPGYWRWSQVTEDGLEDAAVDGHLSAYSDGWDAMSENGGAAWIWCCNCGQVWAVPEDLEWT